MKKLPVFLILFLFVSFLWAQQVAIPPEMPNDDGYLESNKGDEDENGDPVVTSEIPTGTEFRLKNRMVELGFANVSFNVANNFIGTGDFFRDPFYMIGNIRKIINEPQLVYNDPIIINIDDFLNGFKFDFDTAIKPLAFSFNWKDKWGVGLDLAHMEVAGNMSLSGKLMRLQEGKDTFGAGAAIFADVGVPVFFHVNKFKIKLRPAVYLPVVYTEPAVTYTRTNTSNDGREGFRIDVDYDMRIYIPFNMAGIQDGETDALMDDMQNNYWNILRDNLGYDFRLGIEYPWNDWLDIGVDIVNIPVPFAQAKLNHYLHLEGSAYVDTSEIDINTIIENEGDLPDDFWDNVYNYPDEFELGFGYNRAGKKLYRPFTLLFYGNYRPFNSRFLTLIPSLGFSINRLYPEPAAIEGGLSARFDVANVFIASLGMNYNDRKWKNSIDFVFNLRAMEIDLGLSSQSQNFEKSFQGAGLGINFGLKLGW